MRVALCGLAALLLQAQQPAPKSGYVTRPQTWRLEVKGAPGGWTNQPKAEVFVKVVDPSDPKPPKDDAVYEDPDAPRYDEGEEDVQRPVQEKDTWTDRPATPLIYWFNGEKHTLEVRVGYRTNLTLDVQNGENRLEVLNPQSGQRAVRTWWATSSRTRLLVRLSEERVGSRYEYWGGGLQVVEPDHTESIGYEPTPSGGRNHGDRYEHATPLPGTYTVRWFDRSMGVEGYEWGSSEYGGNRRPLKVIVEVYLDPGTEYERRWRFERLVTPGTRRVTLGSFDVED